MQILILNGTGGILQLIVLLCGAVNTSGVQPEEGREAQIVQGDPQPSSPQNIANSPGAEGPDKVRLPSDVDLTPPADGLPARSPNGSSFRGTFAYDPDIGYDYGQYDDNGGRWYEQKRRRRLPRMRRSGSVPGERTFFDPYYDGILRYDRTQGSYDDLGGYLEFHGGVGRRRYWRSRRYIPLRYDDFRVYQRFQYELGGSP